MHIFKTMHNCHRYCKTVPGSFYLARVNGCCDHYQHQRNDERCGFPVNQKSRILAIKKLSIPTHSNTHFAILSIHQAALATKTTISPQKAIAAKTTARLRDPFVCAKCGTNKNGKLSCCFPGGAWYKNCGTGRDYSWTEGFAVCNHERGYEFLKNSLFFCTFFSF